MAEDEEEVTDVVHGGPAGAEVIYNTNGTGSATAYTPVQRVSDVGYIIPPGATAAEVGLNANDGLPLQATLDGTNANITSASSGGAMNIKTTGSENKKIKLGYGFSGYKTVQLKANGQSQIQAQSQNLSAFAGGALSDNDIMWILAVHAAGETPDFKQCEWNVEGNDMYNAGWTVGAWSITQKHNFKILGEKYMSKSEYEFSSADCDIIAKSQPDHRHTI